MVSGDLTDTGDPDAYQRLSAAIGSIGAAADPPLTVFATGNHDVRTEFHRQLLHRNETGPILQVHDVAGCASSCSIRPFPEPATVGWRPAATAELTEELPRPAPAGSIVVLHHAPIPPPSPLLSYFALETCVPAGPDEVDRPEPTCGSSWPDTTTSPSRRRSAGFRSPLPDPRRSAPTHWRPRP